MAIESTLETRDSILSKKSKKFSSLVAILIYLDSLCRKFILID